MAFLKNRDEIGILRGALILFLHDNGGCNEGGTQGRNTVKVVCDTAESFALYGACWANASNTPFRKYKKWIHEGGLSTPLIAHWPNGIAAALNGTLVYEPTHVIDLMTTCVDLSNAKYPETHKGNKIIPMEGKSLRPIFQGKPLYRKAPLIFEHSGNRGIRQGKWKLVSARGGKWELYNMQADRTELNNMVAKQPKIVKEMSVLYNAWAARCFVNKRKKKTSDQSI